VMYQIKFLCVRVCVKIEESEIYQAAMICT